MIELIIFPILERVKELAHQRDICTACKQMFNPYGTNRYYTLYNYEEIIVKMIFKINSLRIHYSTEPLVQIELEYTDPEFLDKLEAFCSNTFKLWIKHHKYDYPEGD